eukprot:gene2475-2632_t
MALENKILEQRLIYKDSVIGVSSLSRCAKALSCFKVSKEGDKAALESFVREILLFQLELNKSQRILKSTENQHLEYEQIQNDILQAIDTTKQEIQNINLELSQARLIRQHRLECENAAQTVTKFQPRSYLNKKMEELNESLSLCEKRKSLYNNQVSQRQSQFNNLICSLGVLEKKLENADEALLLDAVEEELDAHSDRSDREVRDNDEEQNIEGEMLENNEVVQGEENIETMES